MLDALASRRTSKAIGDIQRPGPQSSLDPSLMGKILAAAGNAPFHYACDRQHQEEFASPVPWRTHVLDGKSCRALMSALLESGDRTKVPNMLAVAEALFLVTWLPDAGTVASDVTAKEGAIFEGNLRNMEHVAATGAFIQSLLIACQSEGFLTYWSSGGPLRGQEVFRKVGINENQILLGAVFLFAENPENAEVKSGALAQRRGQVSDWSRFVRL